MKSPKAVFVGLSIWCHPKHVVELIMEASYLGIELVHEKTITVPVGSENKLTGVSEACIVHFDEDDEDALIELVDRLYD